MGKEVSELKSLAAAGKALKSMEASRTTVCVTVHRTLHSFSHGGLSRSHPTVELLSAAVLL